MKGGSQLSRRVVGSTTAPLGATSGNQSTLSPFGREEHWTRQYGPTSMDRVRERSLRSPPSPLKASVSFSLRGMNRGAIWYYDSSTSGEIACSRACRWVGGKPNHPNACWQSILLNPGWLGCSGGCLVGRRPTLLQGKKDSFFRLVFAWFFLVRFYVRRQKGNAIFVFLLSGTSSNRYGVPFRSEG